MSELVLPQANISFYNWGNTLKVTLTTLIIPTPPQSESDWRTWANLLLSINGITATLPTKVAFPKDEDWRKWAWLFIKNYNLNIK